VTAADPAHGEDDMLRRDFLKTAVAAAVFTAAVPAQARKTPANANEHFADPIAG
jgi:hypothetical protein